MSGRKVNAALFCLLLLTPQIHQIGDCVENFDILLKEVALLVDFLLLFALEVILIAQNL